MSSPSYASEPQIQYLSQILEQVERSELLVPDFQRPPRWSDDQRRRLLDSVGKGYPVGALMVWRTDVRILHRATVGNVALTSKPGKTVQYILDGFQRVSTLFGALRGGESRKASPDGDGNRWAIGYHLVEQEWVFLDSIDESDMSVVLPGHLMLDSISLIRFQRTLLDHKDVENLLNRSDAIVRAIREYKIPVIPMVTDSTSEATMTFGLLNTEGTRMSDLDLVVALTWSKNYNLRTQLDEAKEELHRVGWQDLDEKYILASLRSAFDLDLYDKDNEVLIQKFKENPETLQLAIKGLRDAGEFLAEKCGVVTLELLPYSYQAVILGDLLRRFPKRTDKFEQSLVQWFWWTTAWTTFAGVSGYRMKGMMAYLQTLGTEGNEHAPWPWRMANTAPAPMPETSDPRAAKIRALTLYLFQLHGLENVAIRARLEKNAARALVRGLTGLKDVALARDPGNAFLVGVEGEQRLVDALASRLRGASGTKYLRTSQSRKNHLISDEAWAALGKGDGQTFIQLRRHDIERYEEDFLRQIGLPPGIGEDSSG